MDYLCDLITERGTCKTYGIETRTNLAFYPDVAAKVTRAGFRHVTFGLEAIHNHPLEFLNKGFKRHTNENAFTAIRHLPMLFVSNFTARNVGETREPMLEYRTSLARSASTSSWSTTCAVAAPNC